MERCENRRARTKSLLAFLPFACLLLLALLPLIPCLTLSSAQGELLAAFPASGGETFEVSFRHSVNKGTVIERYSVDWQSRTLWLQTGLFENYGAGMMDTVEDGVVHVFEDGYIRLDFPPDPQRQVRYIPGGEARHLFTYGPHTIKLYELSYHRPVVIQPKRVSAAQWLWVSLF